jgi:integrase/recombinase XerC
LNLKAYKAEFLEYLKEIRKYSDATVKTYDIAINQLINNCEIDKTKKGYELNIMKFRLKIANLSKKAISTKLSAVRSFVKFLQKQKQIDIKLIGNQSVKVPQTLPKPLKMQDILNAIDNLELLDSIIIKLLYGLGLRISELEKLQISDIKGSWIEVLGKGNKIRQIPLPPLVLKDLQKYIALYKPKKYLIEKNGKALKETQIRYKIKKSFLKIGIKATPHQLRHSFATHLLENGARISDVSELLGHSSMASTQIYTKLNSQTKMQNYLKAHPLAKE